MRIFEKYLSMPSATMLQRGKVIFIFFILVLFSVSARGQSNSRAKADTAKTSVRVKADTGRIHFQLKPSAAKFDKIDSADLELTTASAIERYGFVDTADLKMKACAFEKDANAMVLFDRGEMMLTGTGVALQRHRRIKIFNKDGKDQADIRIEYEDKYGYEAVYYIEGETINLVNGKIEYTKLDTSLVYFERTNGQKGAVVFTMPRVTAGSIIEYRYIWVRERARNYPKWEFQSDIPTQYSQLELFINPLIKLKAYHNASKPFAIDGVSKKGNSHIWALRDIPAIKNESFMRSKTDALQQISFVVTGFNFWGPAKSMYDSWAETGDAIASEKGFYGPFDEGIRDEGDLLKPAKQLGDNDKKIAYLFNLVRGEMTLNDDEHWFSDDGIRSAWKKKTGNSGEINMILCRLLNKSGIKAYPMLVSTRDNGELNPDFVDFYRINKLVAYVPADSSKYYVLDATDKFNVYNEIPFELLNSYGLLLNTDKRDYRLVYLEKKDAARQQVFMDAEIAADGTMTGTAIIKSFSYNKSSTLEMHKNLDEKKYYDFLTDNDNTLRITSLKMENADVDSLPLVQTVNFKLDLPATNEKYIYLNPNLFTTLHANPFMSKERFTAIDLGCSNTYSITGRYKIPQGYAVDALPNSMNLVINDRSITFKRLIAMQEGYVVVNYVISYKKSIYPLSVYPDVYEYFKKMEETLNEQVVLKKT